MIILYLLLNLSLFAFDANIKKQLIKDTKIYTDFKNTFLVTTLKKNSYVYILKELLHHYYVKTLDNKKGYLTKDSVSEFFKKNVLGCLILTNSCDIFADKNLKHKLGQANAKEKFLVESLEKKNDKILFKTIYGFYILISKENYLFKKEKDV